MGNTDSVPIVSQAKSAVQFSMGDTPGARATQNNFFMNNTFPILSQAASLGYAAAGNNEKALDLQAKFAEDMGTVIDSIPVAGHIKGGIHYALGQNDKGEESMKAASRSVGVVVGGVGGFAAGGPAGGFAGGIAGGLISDSIISGKCDLQSQFSSNIYWSFEIFFILKTERCGFHGERRKRRAVVRLPLNYAFT
jgi:hypothetical protein